MDTITTITPELVMETLYQVVEGKEDFVYPQDERGQCQYVRNGEPSCIAGQVFAKIGVPIDVIARFDRSIEIGGYSADSAEVKIRLAEAGFPVSTSKALGMLRRAQTAQDMGNTWGEAIHRAEEYGL